MSGDGKQHQQPSVMEIQESKIGCADPCQSQLYHPVVGISKLIYVEEGKYCFIWVCHSLVMLYVQQLKTDLCLTEDACVELHPPQLSSSMWWRKLVGWRELMDDH